MKQLSEEKELLELLETARMAEQKARETSELATTTFSRVTPPLAKRGGEVE